MPETKCQNSETEVILFFGKDDIYSQFHPCEFEISGISYNCTEQYMMHRKAVIFGDVKMAEKIMLETQPKVMKAYGRTVGNFDEEIWTSKCCDVVYEGNYAKFSQNEDFKKKLLATGNKLIAEASPFDRRWGIGLGKSNPKALDQKLWRGKNWLGQAIMRVRNELIEET